MVWRFKRATLLTLISISVAIVFTIISLSILGPIKSFVSFIDKGDIFVIENNKMTLTATNMSFDVSNLTREEILYYLWKSFLILNIASLCIFIICLIFTILSFNDYKLNFEAFTKKKKIHTTYLVFLILSFISFLNNTLVLIYPESLLVSLGYLAVFIIFIVSMVYAIKGIKDSKLLMFVPEKANNDNMDYSNINNQEHSNENNNNINTWANERHNVENSNATVNNEKTLLSQEELKSIYEYLAKLEDSHRKGEISDEEYQKSKEKVMKSLDN